MLKSDSILDEGIGAVRELPIWPEKRTFQALARTVAERSIKSRAAKREPKAYSVYKRTVHVSGSRDGMDEQMN